MSFAKSLVALASLVSSAAFATDTPTVTDLANVQAERVMISAQVQRAKAQAELASYGPASGNASIGTVSPSLRMVYGSYGVNYGLFVFSTGGTATGKAGDTLPGHYKVKAVSLQGADLVDEHGAQVRVPLSNAAPIEPSKAAAQTNGSTYQVMPGPMPMLPPPTN